MIVLESFDTEDFALGEDGIIAVPLDVFVEGDEVNAVSYRLCREMTEANIMEILSGECEVFTKKLCEKMAPYGYCPAEDIGEKIFSYSTSSPLKDTGTKTTILRTNEEIARYGADTSLWKLEVDDADPMDVICAVIREGTIVASACVNDLTEDGVPEINVECSVNHRCKGYGTAVTAGITDYLLTDFGAECVVYRCRERNTASRHLAEKAGFELNGYEIPFVFYRNI